MIHTQPEKKNKKWVGPGDGAHLEDLHEDFPSDPSIEHGQVLKRSKHVSQLDHDVGELAVSILAVNHGLKRSHIENIPGKGRGVHETLYRRRNFMIMAGGEGRGGGYNNIAGCCDAYNKARLEICGVSGWSPLYLLL